MVSEKLIQEIKDRVDIIDLISKYTPLKPSGRTHSGLCPFHNENSPSFHVYTDKGIYKCFGCGEGGDCYSFLMKIENYGFMESVEHFASILGINIPKNESSQYERLDEEIFQLNQLALRYFAKNLSDGKGVNALRYITKRGLDPNTIKKFEIGLAFDEWSSLSDYLIKKGFSVEKLIQAGLSVKTAKSGRIIDRFRDRILFPIKDKKGRAVGFSGRALKENERAKYLNSPETTVFKKSQLLYAMDLAREGIAKKKRLIVCEGHIDVCMMHMYGFTETVGTQGTAFTEQHGQWLSRQSKQIYILFDSDKAGINAALKILPIGLKFELVMKFIPLPSGEDPASFLLSNDTESLENLIKSGTSLFDYKVKHILGGEYSPEKLNQVIIEMKADLLEIKNPILYDSYIQHLGSVLKISSDVIHNHIKPGGNEPPKKMSISNSSKGLEKVFESNHFWERLLLYYILTSVDDRSFIFESLNSKWMLQKQLKSLFNFLSRIHSEQQFELSEILNKVKDLPYTDIIKKILSENHSELNKNLLSEILLNLEKRYLESKVILINSEIKRLEIEQSPVVEEEIVNLNNTLKKLSEINLKLSSIKIETDEEY